MEQFRQIGEVLGSLKALMVFRDEIQINRKQCCLLVDVCNLGFEAVADTIKQNLKFDEKGLKWKSLEQSLKELCRIFREVEQYVRQCLEIRDWLIKAVSLSQSSDCVEFHVHNLLLCVTVVIEAIEMIGEISGSDQSEIYHKKILHLKKYDEDFLDPKLFQMRFGNQYIVSLDICSKLDTVRREDVWILLDKIKNTRKNGSKQANRVAEILSKKLNDFDSLETIFLPSSMLISSKDYHVRRRLGSGNKYKEIQWMGESFVLRHFYAEIDSIESEIANLSKLSHPHIVQILCGFCDEQSKEWFLVMELMNRDLGCYIKEISAPKRKTVPFSLPVAVDIMLQIARGMEYLHSQKIYHGDLNPSNILVRTKNSLDGHIHVKISGFGLSNVKNLSSRNPPNQTDTDSKPFIWYAPEVLSDQEQLMNPCNSKYTEKADVYSFGMICFEVLTGKVPFEDDHLQGDKMSRNIRTGERPLFPFPLQKYFTNLIKKCWHNDPVHRPNFSSICRVLRYAKRFLITNPDQNQATLSSPSIDFCEIENNLKKKFLDWNVTEMSSVTSIPFQMFAYKVMEEKKNSLSFRERSSESGSEGTGPSNHEDENPVLVDDICITSSIERPLIASNTKKKPLVRKFVDKTANQPSVQTLKGKVTGHPQLTPYRQRPQTNMERRHHSITMSPGRRRSGYSDSEVA